MKMESVPTETSNSVRNTVHLLDFVQNAQVDLNCLHLANAQWFVLRILKLKNTWSKTIFVLRLIQNAFFQIQMDIVLNVTKNITHSRENATQFLAPISDK